MSLLLDTHIFLWWLADAPDLKDKIRRAIATTDTVIFVSAASVWEISIKTALGKINIRPDDVINGIRDSGFTDLSVRVEHGLRAGMLPRHHRDPFDRMLVAQAQEDGLTLVTHDRRIEPYDVPILWA